MISKLCQVEFQLFLELNIHMQQISAFKRVIRVMGNDLKDAGDVKQS